MLLLLWVGCLSWAARKQKQTLNRCPSSPTQHPPLSRSVAVAGFSGALWGTLVLLLAALAAFNFARAGG